MNVHEILAAELNISVETCACYHASLSVLDEDEYAEVLAMNGISQKLSVEDLIRKLVLRKRAEFKDCRERLLSELKETYSLSSQHAFLENLSKVDLFRAYLFSADAALRTDI